MSDDYISRQMAIYVFKNAIGDKYPFICEPILTTLSLIPSVTPKNTVSVEAYKQVMRERDIAIQQLNELGYEFGEKIKTGHWINLQLIPDDITGHTHGECSVCHKVRIVDKYCPNCGAKMEV